MRPCSVPGCGTLVASGACEKHRKQADRDRGKTVERGYGADHRRLRELKLATDPFCQIQTECQGAPATEIDHILPISERPDLRLEWSNIQSSCKPCNVAKRNREKRTKSASTCGSSVPIARIPPQSRRLDEEARCS